MADDAKAVLRKWFDEVWNERRDAAIDQLAAPHSLVHGLGPDLRGPEGFKTFHTSFCNAFPDIHVTLEDLVCEGTMVAARWRATGTHRGDGLGFPATGKPVSFTGMVFARVENGQLVEGWNTLDQLGMLQQLGVVSPPG